MRRTRIERAALCVALATALAVTRASAQPADARAEARTHFDQGVSLARQRAYAEALTEFERAYQIFPHYTVQYNIGQALVALNRPTGATLALTRYLDEGGANIEPRRRQEVEATIANALAKTSTIEVTVDIANALITIDDKPSGRSPLTSPIRVDSGTHRIIATLDSGEHRETSVDAKAGQSAQAKLEFGAQTVAAPAAPPAPVQPSPPAPVPVAATQTQRETTPTSHRSTRKTIGYVVGATGIALTGAAAAHFFWNRARYQDWQTRYSAYYDDPTDQNRESANSLASSVSNASAVTVGLAIGAGVALGTGAVLLLTSSSSGVSASGTVGPGGPFMTLRGKF